MQTPWTASNCGDSEVQAFHADEGDSLLRTPLQRTRGSFFSMESSELSATTIDISNGGDEKDPENRALYLNDERSLGCPSNGILSGKNVPDLLSRRRYRLSEATRITASASWYRLRHKKLKSLLRGASYLLTFVAVVCGWGLVDVLIEITADGNHFVQAAYYAVICVGATLLVGLYRLTCKSEFDAEMAIDIF